MRVPDPSKSVVTAVKALAATVGLPLKLDSLYELAVTHDTWVRQSRSEAPAEAGVDGSMLVFKGRVVTLSGYHGSVLSVVRDKADGIAVITPLAEV